jgi:hypothetical protein
LYFFRKNLEIEQFPIQVTPASTGNVRSNPGQLPESVCEIFYIELENQDRRSIGVPDCLDSLLGGGVIQS